MPYIYSQEELKRLLDAIPVACTKRSAIDAYVFRALIFLLYGAGLRLGEALALTLNDVDLQQTCLDVRETKFFKHRLVPMGTDLTTVMRAYLVKRNGLHAALAGSPLLCCRDGSALSQSAARNAFRRLRTVANIALEGGARRQPRLHDLRHTAAVHRVIAWYRSGVDLQERLPKLATYLGHVDLSATQRYLTMNAMFTDFPGQSGKTKSVEIVPTICINPVASASRWRWARGCRGEIFTLFIRRCEVRFGSVSVISRLHAG